MQFDVTVQIEGEDVPAGRLYQSVRHGDETATFRMPPRIWTTPAPSHWLRTCLLGRGPFIPRGFGSFERLRIACPTAGGAT